VGRVPRAHWSYPGQSYAKFRKFRRRYEFRHLPIIFSLECTLPTMADRGIKRSAVLDQFIQSIYLFGGACSVRTPRSVILFSDAHCTSSLHDNFWIYRSHFPARRLSNNELDIPISKIWHTMTLFSLQLLIIL